ncbi:MAG: trypsin-like peptidase domain-containing protein [Pseudomonadota bacterium]
MVSRLCLALLFVALTAAPARADETGRRYSLSEPVAQPVVRILVDRFEANGQYRNGTGVLAGRCDVMLTARHVLRDAKPAQVQVYSPQIRGQVAGIKTDAAAQSLRNVSGSAQRRPGRFDDDVVVVRLDRCPTYQFVPLSAIQPLQFRHLKALRSAGFACDSRHKRAPEITAFEGTFVPFKPGQGLSRQVRLSPGARPGQSGAPIFSVDAQTGERQLHMLLVATLRDRAAPVGCGIDEETGQSDAGHAAYGAVLTQQFMDAFKAYIAALAD